MGLRNFADKLHPFWINKDLQSGFILFFCLTIPIGGLLSTGIVLFFFESGLTTVFVDSRLVITNTALFALPAVLYASLITIVIISLAMIGITLLVSYKIADPLRRLEEDITLIADGNLAHRTCLHESDPFLELSQDINRITVRMNTKLANMQNGLTRVIVSASEQGTPAGFMHELHLLHDRIGRYFTLNRDADTEKASDKRPDAVLSGTSKERGEFEYLVKVGQQIEAMEENQIRATETDRSVSATGRRR